MRTDNSTDQSASNRSIDSTLLLILFIAIEPDYGLLRCRCFDLSQINPFEVAE